MLFFLHTLELSRQFGTHIHSLARVHSRFCFVYNAFVIFNFDWIMIISTSFFSQFSSEWCCVRLLRMRQRSHVIFGNSNCFAFFFTCIVTFEANKQKNHIQDKEFQCVWFVWFTLFKLATWFVSHRWFGSTFCDWIFWMPSESFASLQFRISSTRKKRWNNRTKMCHKNP